MLSQRPRRIRKEYFLDAGLEIIFIMEKVADLPGD